MARRKAKAGMAQKRMGYSILTVLGAITIWLFIQQSHFNPAVTITTHPPPLQGRIQTVSGQPLAATAALLPEVSGFTPLAPVESYGPEKLSDKINGKAELYLSAGFQEMSCRSFILGEVQGAHVEVFLYDMGSAPNAFAVFSGQRRSGATSIALTPHAYATANALFLAQGRFYVEIVADRPLATLGNSLEAYATALLAKLPPPAGAPETANLLPKEGLIQESVRLVATDTFGLEGFQNVFTGEYTLKAGKATAFIARRDSPKQAQAEAKRYQEFLTANGYQRVEATGPDADTPVLALDNSFEMIFVAGQTLAGVHDATTLAAALELSQKLTKQLREVK